MKRVVIAALLVAGCRADEAQPPDAAPPQPDVPVQTIADLRFAVVGDTRPVNVDDTPNYPVQVIDKIWSDVAAAQPAPLFAISTGDYMFANANGQQASAQLDIYLAARDAFSSPVYAAMGNHECNGYTNSNCGPGNADGMTINYAQYMTRMVQPLGFTKPWFDAYYQAADGTWTAKVIVVAANAWNAEQASWLDAALSVPSTYTFVVRHEADSADTAPGTTPSKTIIAAHPVTLQIFGHTHTYQHQPASHSVIIGNGGAPLSGGVDYGYAIVSRRSDGGIQLDEHDYMTNAIVDAWAISADGTPSDLIVALALAASCGKKKERAPVHAPPPASRPVAVSPIAVPAARAAIPIDGEWEADWNDRAARVVLHAKGGADEARPYSEVRLLRDGDALLVGLYAADEEIHSNEFFDVKIGSLGFHATAGGKLEPAVPGATAAIDVDGTVDHPGDFDEEWKLEISIPLAALGADPSARAPVHVARCDTPKDGIERCGEWDGELAPRASWPAR